MNKLNYIFVTQAEFDALVTAQTLKANAKYYISVGGNKFKQAVVSSTGVVFEQAGLDLIALGAYLTDNGYITQSALTTAIADFATNADVTAAIGTLNTAIQSALNGLDSRVTTAETAIVDAEGRLTTAETDITGLKGRMSAAEAKLVTALELIANGITPVFVEFGSIQTTIDALDLSEDKNYAVIVTSTDNAGGETVSVLGTSYVLNTASTLYLKVEADAIVSVNHDNNNVYALISNLQGSVTDVQDLISSLQSALNTEKQLRIENDNTLAQRPYHYVYEPQFAGDKTAVEIAQDVLGGLLSSQDAGHSMPTAFDFSVTIKGNPLVVTAEGTTTYNCKADDILKISIEKVGSTWTCMSSKHYPAPANAAALLQLQPYMDTKSFNASGNETIANLLNNISPQLGKPADTAVKKCSIFYRCHKNVTGVITLEHEYPNPDYDANLPGSAEYLVNTYTLGADSCVMFNAQYDAAADEWKVVHSSVLVDESYNAIQEGTF